MVLYMVLPTPDTFVCTLHLSLTETIKINNLEISLSSSSLLLFIAGVVLELSSTKTGGCEAQVCTEDLGESLLQLFNITQKR